MLSRLLSKRRFAAALALGLLLVDPATTSAAPGAEAAAKKLDAFVYKVAMDDPHRHEFQVELSFSDLPGEVTDLQLPRWNPGAYRVTEAHRNVRGMVAETAGGKPIPVVKVDEITWRVTHGGQPFKVRYRVYRGSYSGIGGAFLDDEFGFFNGVYLFPYAVGHKDRPIELRVEGLPGAQVVCALPRAGSGGKAFKANDYDMLVDAPVHVGKVDTINFKAGKVQFHVALQGIGNYSDKKLAADLTKIADTTYAIFGGEEGVPFTDYTYILHLRPGGRSGLEHRNSTAIGLEPWIFGDPAAYRKFLNTAAHEFFHAWNVKRIRPGVLGPFAYEREVHTSMLWFSEGFTSYYAWVILARAGLASEAEAMEALGEQIKRLQESPGRKLMTVEQASWEAWLRPDDGSNSYVDYYNKGMLIALALDLELRRISGGQRSLDTVMRELYGRWKNTGAGISPTELEATFVAAGGGAGAEISELFRKYVHGFDEIEFGKHLRLAGYKVDMVQETGGDLELVFAEQSDKGALIELVRQGGAGDKAGLANGDVLVAIDGLKIAGAAEAKRQIKAMAGNSRHTLTIQRGARMIERTAVPSTGGPVTYKIALDPGATYEQMVLRQAWLGYTAPAPASGNSTLRDAALKLFNQDPTLGAEPEDGSVVVVPAGGKKKTKKPAAKKPAKPPAK
ncbi:PDZ domain-containing protein [Nannocystis exedens]|uniref:PDZ domain-containing protein n=1 Tax=Nannocystis exedens TaxID=54 RepID=A0A1I2A7P6_9BACT|nr:PDZ domain-containing protein [Nannocystis exedens]PCC69679.1 peptidase M61 [Nannocystis exedens]SFE39739.1 PDZ domain-containing protein [Nannocystis exedens]